MLSADGLDLAGLDAIDLGLTSQLIVPDPGGEEVPADDEKAPITPLPNSPLLDLSEEDTFNLASNPDSPFTIFLDFDGHVTQDPGWDAALANTRPRFGQPFTTPLFNVDNDPFNFSDLELDIIQESFVRVAEDFAPFDVNVTTIQPPIEDLENDGTLGDRYGIRVAIGGSNQDWLGEAGVGGIALLGSFASPLDTPAFAFIEGGIANPTSQALVISHEVGHSLGLEHWGNLIFPTPPFDPDFPPVSFEFNENYPGQGFNNPNGLSWGPILGATFGVAVTQWSNGDYFAANNPAQVRPRPVIDDGGNIVFDPDTGETVEAVDDDGNPLFFNDFDPTNNPETTVDELSSILLQDDLAVITGNNGFTFRDDDHAGSGEDYSTDGVLLPGFDFSTASLLDSNFASDVATGFGLIETNTDYDFFAFDTDGGTITIDATPNAFGANLDILFEVYGPDGQLIDIGAADFQLEASLTFNAEEPGRYFIAVTGDAYRTNAPLSEQQTQGYSDYGSLGRYTLTVNGDLGAPPDEFEVNDSIPQATDIAALFDEGDFSADDLSIHVTGDEDFFRWQASDDGVLNISADFLQSEGDLELFLLDETGEVVGQSIGRENGEDLSIPVLDGEVYFVRVVGVNGATQESYSLLIDGPGLAADEFEENDTFETAFAIPGEDFFAVPNLHVPGDEDFFLYQAATDSETVFSLAAGATDLTFQVLQGTSVIATGQPNLDGSLGLSTTLTVNTGDLFRVRVFSPSGQTITQYQLFIDGTAAVGDRLEPNTESSPTIIDTTPIAVFNNISIHTTQDTDFFSFTAPSFGTLNVDANFQDFFGDLDVRIVDTSTDELLALGSSITDNESLSIPVEAGITYLIETFGFQGDLVPVYGLTTEFIADAPSGVTGDANGDGLVNQEDREVWLRQAGTTGENLSSDFDGSGRVDTADYAVWREALSAQTAAVAAAQSAPIANETSGGHGPGCNCASCSGRASAVAHDHNGDGIADHAGHDHLHGSPAYPGIALPVLSEPLLPPDRSATLRALPVVTLDPVASPATPPPITQPSFVEVEPVIVDVEPVAPTARPTLSLTLVGVGLGESEIGTDLAPAPSSAAVTPTSDLALLLIDSAFEEESDEDALESLADKNDEDQQAREDAFALVNDLG